MRNGKTEKGVVELGQVRTTEAALVAINKAKLYLDDVLSRHILGDWGDLGAEANAVNDQAFLDGGRLLSAYILPYSGEIIWVTTEPNRSATTLFLDSEF